MSAGTFELLQQHTNDALHEMSNLIISKRLSVGKMRWSGLGDILTYHNYGNSNLRFCYQLAELLST